MIVGAVQLNVIKYNKDANLDKIESLIDTPVDLVVLPELFSTGYFFDAVGQMEEAAEVIPGGYTTERLIQTAKVKNCHLLGAIVEQDRMNYYITAVVVGPQGYIGKHRKRQLTDDEKVRYSAGSETRTFDIEGCRIGAIICFEGWFPETARFLMLQGAQIMCHSVLTTQQRTLDIMRVRAMENKAYVILANSISTELYREETVTFRGNSRIIDYQGNILIDAGQEERLITAEIDEKLTQHKDLEDCKDLASAVMSHRYLDQYIW